MPPKFLPAILLLSLISLVTNGSLELLPKEVMLHELLNYFSILDLYELQCANKYYYGKVKAYVDLEKKEVMELEVISLFKIGKILSIYDYWDVLFFLPNWNYDHLENRLKLMHEEDNKSGISLFKGLKIFKGLKKLKGLELQIDRFLLNTNCAILTYRNVNDEKLTNRMNEIESENHYVETLTLGNGEYILKIGAAKYIYIAPDNKSHLLKIDDLYALTYRTFWGELFVKAWTKDEKLQTNEKIAIPKDYELNTISTTDEGYFILILKANEDSNFSDKTIHMKPIELRLPPNVFMLKILYWTEDGNLSDLNLENLLEKQTLK